MKAKKGKKVRAAIYSRVSTQRQIDRTDYDSMKSHLDKCKHYIQAQDDWKLKKVYEDPAETGDKWGRAKLQEMLADVRNGRIDVLITYKLDRISRSVRHFHEILKILEENEVALVSVTQGFDTSSPAGKLLRNILIDFSQFERDMISERVKDKRLARAKKGLWNGGPIPYGYRVEDGKLILVPEEAKTVKAMFETFKETKSRSKVREKLALLGAKTRKGKPFSKGSVERILTNPIYAGKIYENGKNFKGIHEAIIDDKLFFALNKITPLRIYRGKSKTDRVYLLKGLVRCGKHKCRMTPYYVQKKDRQVHYYSCTKSMQYKHIKCPMKYANADKVETYVIERLKELADQKPILRDIVAQLNLDIDSETKQFRDQLDELTARRKEVKEQVENLIDGISASGSKTVNRLLEKRIEKLQGQLTELEKKKSDLTLLIASSPSKVNAEIVLDHLKDFSNLYDELTPEERVTYLQCVIQDVTVHREKLSIRIHSLQEPAVLKGSKIRTKWLGEEDSNLH